MLGEHRKPFFVLLESHRFDRRRPRASSGPHPGRAPIARSGADFVELTAGPVECRLENKMPLAVEAMGSAALRCGAEPRLDVVEGDFETDERIGGHAAIGVRIARGPRATHLRPPASDRVDRESSGVGDRRRRSPIRRLRTGPVAAWDPSHAPLPIFYSLEATSLEATAKGKCLILFVGRPRFLESVVPRR